MCALHETSNGSPSNPAEIPIWCQQAVSMRLRDGRKVWITFQVCDVSGPIMSVGKFCTKGNDRCATFTTSGGVLWHEEAGEIYVDRVRNHYELECWIKPRNVLAPVQIGGSSGSTGESAGHHVAVPQRTDAEILMDAQPQGAHALRVDEEYVEPEILPVASLPGPREPSMDEIEKHNLLHDPAMLWCDICIQSKSRDDFHRRARPKVLPVIQFDYAVAGTHQEQPHFDFMVGTDMSTGAAWASAVLIKGKEDPYIVSSILSCISEPEHSKVIIQTDGEPASEVVMRMIQSKGAMMENPPCEIIQQQSQRYSHESNGGAERMVRTIRNQIKAYKIQIEKNSGITIKDDNPLLTWLPRYATWQYTRLHQRQDSTTTAFEKIRHERGFNSLRLIHRRRVQFLSHIQKMGSILSVVFKKKEVRFFESNSKSLSHVEKKRFSSLRRIFLFVFMRRVQFFDFSFKQKVPLFE